MSAFDAISGRPPKPSAAPAPEVSARLDSLEARLEVLIAAMALNARPRLAPAASPSWATQVIAKSLRDSARLFPGESPAIQTENIIRHLWLAGFSIVRRPQTPEVSP